MGVANAFTWLRENAPELRENEFEVLRHRRGEAAEAFFWGSFRKSPSAACIDRPRMRRKATWKFSGGILKQMLSLPFARVLGL